MPNASDNYFEIQEKIGEGWSSKVFLAVLKDDRYGLPKQTLVALKAFKQSAYMEEPNMHTRVLREFEIMHEIQHQNLLPVFALEDLLIENVRHQTLVLEYCKCRDLFSFLKKHWPLEAAQLDIICRGLTEGMAHLHASEVLHRDLKPQNVLVTDSGVPKISDFGVARTASAQPITGSSQFLGTVRYASPEVLEGEPENKRSDVYSAGTVIYKLLFGCCPLHELSRYTAVAATIVNKGIDWPTDLNRFGTACNFTHIFWESVGQNMTAFDAANRPSFAKIVEWMAEGTRCSPVRARVAEVTEVALRRNTRKLKLKANSELYFFAKYNAARVAELMTEEEIVRSLLGDASDVVEANSTLLNLAVAPLPFDSYEALDIELRQEFVEAFLGEREYYIGQVPYDDYMEIERLQSIFSKYQEQLYNKETDPELKTRLGSR